MTKDDILAEIAALEMKSLRMLREKSLGNPSAAERLLRLEEQIEAKRQDIRNLTTEV